MRRDPELVTVTEAATMLGVARVTVWRMVRAGDLVAVARTPGGDARGGRAYLRRADVLARCPDAPAEAA